MMAPTERSMPAVRITSVCAAATMPTICTCCRISVSDAGREELASPGARRRRRSKRAARSAAPAPASTCSACWNRLSEGCGPRGTRPPPRRGAPATHGLEVVGLGSSRGLPRVVRRGPSRPPVGPGAGRSPPPSRSVWAPRARPIKPSCGRQPQQRSVPSSRSIDSTPSAGLSVTSATPVSKKSLPSVVAGRVPSSANCGDRLDAERGHLQRVLLRGGADHAVLDVLDAGAAAVDRDDQHVVLAAHGLQRLVGAGGGGLVDRVDDVDVGVLPRGGSPSPCGRLPRCRW